MQSQDASSLDRNEWQIAGTKAAISLIEHEGTIADEDIVAWIDSWDTKAELPASHSSHGGHDRRGGFAVVKDASFARAGAAGAIVRCLQRAFLRTPSGILDNNDPLAKLAAER
jgi:hypothetical protein